MKVSLLTPTGNRPEAFALCERWMAQQTYKPDFWIVVDDGVEPTPVSDPFIKYIRAPIPWQPGQNTQKSNLQEGTKHYLMGDVVFIIEDDDYYAPTYLEDMLGMLSTQKQKESINRGYVYPSLIGSARARYYHLRTRTYRVMGNTHHASLAQTGMTKEVVQDVFSPILETERGMFDIKLWNSFSSPNVYMRGVLDKKTNNHVSIKGMPGRPGIGVGHDARVHGAWHKDPDLKRFKDWVGPDYVYYEPYLG